MSSILEALKSAVSKPLEVHQVGTPEILEANRSPEMSEDQAYKLSIANIAELSGEEMDEFVSLWSEIKERYAIEDAEAGMHYKRAAAVFCLCDKDRNRSFKDAKSVWEVMGLLAQLPSTLTSRLFVVANASNAFVGLDDETKKRLKDESRKPKKGGGNGGQRLASDSQAGSPGSDV